MPLHPRTILITGIDLTGKTTLGKGLVTKLRERGFDATFRCGAFSQQKLWERARSQMTMGYLADKKRLYAINSTLLIAYALDRLPTQENNDITSSHNKSILIQDSYAERTVAFCRTHGVCVFPDILEAIRERKFGFDINIQLYADTATRLARYERMNGGRTSLEEELLDDEHRAQQMHEEIYRQIKHERNYLLIDTSIQTPEMTLSEAVRFFTERSC
jgi:thymidylate kinase